MFQKYIELLPVQIISSLIDSCGVWKLSIVFGVDTREEFKY